MFKRLFAAALDLLGMASSKVTGAHAFIPQGFYRRGGTHGSTHALRLYFQESLMFKRLFAAALDLLGMASSKVTGAHAFIPQGFYRRGGTHGSTHIRRFRSLKEKRRRGL